MTTYEEQVCLFEKQLWRGNGADFETNLLSYHRLFQEYESSIKKSGDNRFDFILNITIADRPEHLQACLESIFQLCNQFNYGGVNAGAYRKVSVIVVEDSEHKHNVEQDIELCKKYTQLGLTTHHYGLDEQYRLLQQVPNHLKNAVSSIIGDTSVDKFYHKGQAITRNLSYLKLLDLPHNRDKTLYYFVDSDQLFQTSLATKDGEKRAYALNYFYYINQIFQQSDINILTGKLVGDPPVSPSVMTVNFLDDVITFFKKLATHTPNQECQFHPQNIDKPADAAYHDMAQLFGFEHEKHDYDYRCEIKTQHDNVACLQNFAQRINFFFFGEHLTRKTFFKYDGSFNKLVPARTIYPGNYICNFSGLKYIIPFGKLRLRMSGPTAGRLIAQEIKEKFASVNLPMLHTRTLNTKFSDEYRPGVEDKSDNIDLSDEFERQFFGDLMLFSVVKLTEKQIKPQEYTKQNLTDTIEVVEQELLQLYSQKQQNVLTRCEQLSEILHDPKQWWNQDSNCAQSVNQLQQFIKNCQHNFAYDSEASKLIQSKQHRNQRKQQIIEALLKYYEDRKAWDQLVNP